MESPSPYNNEIHPEHLGMLGLNFAARHNSASRSVMFGSHFSQRLIIKGLSEKRIQTGVEQEFSKYTFSVKMPENGRIIRLIDRYPRGIGQDSMGMNPQTLVVYENEQTHEIDCFSVPLYASYHQFFGFEYKFTEHVNKLRQGAYIAKDTVFADSPAVTENNGYAPGISANVAFMSVPSASEDGIMVSESFLDKLKYKIYETRVVEFGSSEFPLNLYGSPAHYKPFPEIGEYIREDGVLMMLRAYDPESAPVDMSVYDTMEPDFDFDRATYVRGGKGRIVDIKVIRNNSSSRQLPSAMSGLMEKYWRALTKFYSEIIAAEQTLRKDYKKKLGVDKLPISPRFQRLLVEARAVTGHKPTIVKNQDRSSGPQMLNLNYRKTPIDEYRVEFVIEYEMAVGIGNKLTDSHGTHHSNQ